MAGRPSTDPALLDEALRRVAAGQHRIDVAAELTAEGRPISERTIRREQLARRSLAPVMVPYKPKAKRPPLEAPPVPPIPAAPALPVTADAVAEIDGLIASTKGHQQALVGKQGYSGAGTLLVSLIKLRAAIERERAKPGADLAHVLGQGAAALAKIRQGAATVAAGEAETGCCARCGAKLAKEVAA